MVGRQVRIRNSRARFAAPPWEDQSPERLKITLQLETDHVAWEIDAAVDRLDLTPLFESYSGVGSAPHSPALMLRMALYATHNGWSRPSEWFRGSRENLVMQWLGRGIGPSRSTWYEFHDRVTPFMDLLNQQVLAEAIEAGVTRAERGALDGSSIAASASRRRLIDAKRLDTRLAQLEAACTLDDQGHTPQEIPAWMAKTPAARRAQRTRFQQAQIRLREREEENQRRSPSERNKKVVVSPSEPEVALGLDKEHVFRPLYTAQVIRDLDSQLILGYDLYAQATDANTLAPLLDRLVWFTLQLHNPKRP